ncbi:hypothetical protein M5K25_005478 [Dendrobium thyrsiflorum]|uniref:Transcription initiation factor TFIID subunit 2 n=1 Tax=Dendrobium thyrsiflorum TaxID=117978 RepID=A0ABD0VIW6_DENTH
MAKPRKQKSDEQKHENSGGVVLHQKLCISVDMENRRVYGHTEMKVVVPESGVIALHAENMIINNITVDGKDAEFECIPHYQFTDDESSWCSVSCSKSAADAACSSYISSLNRETSPNLIITCCNKSKEPQSNMGLNLPENIIQSSCAEQVVNGCNEHPEDKDVKIICIDYWLDQTETGIHFGERLLHTDNQIRRVHCWFPCMYTFSQHCLFDLEFTVSSNFVAVSNGDLLYQVLSNDDPPRKTFIYKLNVPVSAAWISVAVAPFEVLPDNHIGIVSHMCLASDLQKLQNTVGFFHNAFRHYEDYLSTSFPFGSYKQVFIPPEISISSVNMGASMCLFSSKLLFDEKVIDQTIETRIKLAYALARQWFGVYIVAEEPNDEWLLEGLAGFLTDSFIKGFLGNNEARYRRYKILYFYPKSSLFSLSRPYSLSPTADQANLSKSPAAPTLLPILSRRPCMGDPDVDHGSVFDDQGRMDILASPFFDVHFDNDETSDDYVDRILYQLTLSLEEHIPPGRWYIVNNPSSSPNSTTSPATITLRAACLLVASLSLFATFFC